MKLAPNRNRIAGSSSRCAFTLAEVLAALVFMAIVIPVALSGLSIASRAGEYAVRKSQAALVAERVLTETVLLTNYSVAQQSGTTRQGLADYEWTVRNEPWNEDTYASEMRLLTVEVKFASQGRDCTLHLSTLIDSSAQYGTNTTQQQ